MTTAIIRTEYERDMFVKRLMTMKLPLSITSVKGAKRSLEQNRLQRAWMREIAEQLQDQTAEEVRGYCKLTIGVPILRAENDEFAAKYDQYVKPLPYEQKLALMMEPFDFAVTRIMTVDQKTRYLDEVARHWAAQGVILTER